MTPLVPLPLTQVLHPLMAILKKWPNSFSYYLLLAPVSFLAQRKIKIIAKKYCKDLYISLAFTSCKVSNMFSAKDPMCSVPRWFTNLHGQDVTPVMSVKPLDILGPGFVNTFFQIAIPISINIFRVLSHKNLSVIYCSFNCFSILNLARTNYQVKIKEALHIEWEWPALNKQLKHVDLTLLL